MNGVGLDGDFKCVLQPGADPLLRLAQKTCPDAGVASSPKAHSRRLCNSKLPIPDHAQVKVIWSRLHILMVRSHGIKVPVRCSGCGSHDRSVDCGLCLCNQAIEAPPPIKTSRRWIIYAQGWCDFPLVLVRIQWQQDLRLAKTIGSKIAGNWVKVTRRSWL